MFMEQLGRLGHEVIDYLRSPLRGGIAAGWWQWFDTKLLWVGVVHLVAKVVAAEHHHKAMFPDWLHKKLNAANFDFLESLTHRHTTLGSGPACPAISDAAFAVHRAKVAACGYVALADGEVNPKSFENAPANAVLQWIVPKKP
jgi:hypothetical protein